MVLQARLISLSHHYSSGKMKGLRYQECIGTSGYSTCPELCGQRLNSSEGRNSATDMKTLANIGEVGYSRSGGRFYFNLHNFLVRGFTY